MVCMTAARPRPRPSPVPRGAESRLAGRDSETPVPPRHPAHRRVRRRCVVRRSALRARRRRCSPRRTRSCRASRSLEPTSSVVEVALGQVGDAYFTPADLDDGPGRHAHRRGRRARAVGCDRRCRRTHAPRASSCAARSTCRRPSTPEASSRSGRRPLLEHGAYDVPRILVADATVVSVTARRFDDRRRRRPRSNSSSRDRMSRPPSPRWPTTRRCRSSRRRVRALKVLIAVDERAEPRRRSRAGGA